MELKKAANHPYLFDGAEVQTDSKEETLKGLVTNSGKIFGMSKEDDGKESYFVLGVPCSLGAPDLLYLIRYAYVIYTYVVIW